MATKLYFSRDTKLIAHVPQSAAATKSMYYDIPVLDGFSFSQATNTSEITLNEAQSTAGASRRGRAMFNDSYAPVEWSFSTYMMPFTSAGGTKGTSGKASATDGAHCEVTEALWAMFFGQTVNSGVTSDATNLDIVQSGANKATVGVFDLFFIMGASQAATAYNFTTGAATANQMIYKLSDCSVGDISFDFDLDGIATVNWSGNGKLITEEATLNLSSSDALINEGVSNTTGFIRNRISDLTITAAAGQTSLLGDGNAKTYSSTLTGGNISWSNNLTYLTPETLGVVNQPLGHVTGTKSITGNFTCYLDNASATSSAEFYEDIVEASDDIQNSFSLSFDIGGSGTPHCIITMPQAHLEVPSHSIDEVISLETNFHALPSDFDSTDEISVFQFVGKDVNA
tara:strand:+ start:935 stop:2131 length:1197 start_codon:yes stop_codon:yes gene_type:complete